MNMESHHSEKFSESYDIAKRQTGTSRLVVWLCSIVGLVCILLGFYLVIRGATGGFNNGWLLRVLKLISLLLPQAFFSSQVAS
jgi:uncharacterized membrane protein